MDFPFTRYAIANLINPCEAVDQLDEGMLLFLLPQEFYHLSLDIDRDLPLWEDEDDQQSASHANALWKQQLKQIQNVLN